MAGKNSTRSIRQIRKLMKGALYTMLSFAALCLVLLIASCVRPGAEIFQRLFILSGLGCLAIGALLTIIVFVRPQAQPKSKYVDSATPMSCHTADSFRAAFVSSIEEKRRSLPLFLPVQFNNPVCCIIPVQRLQPIPYGFQPGLYQ